MSFAQDIIDYIMDYDVDADPGDLVESVLEMAEREENT